MISRGGEAIPWQFRDDNRKRGVIPNAETSCGFENVVWITSFEVNHAARRPHLAGLFPLPFKGRAGVGMGFRTAAVMSLAPNGCPSPPTPHPSRGGLQNMELAP